jgi:hypothetical protein
VELALRKLKKLKPQNEEEIERDKKYFAFNLTINKLILAKSYLLLCLYVITTSIKSL